MDPALALGEAAEKLGVVVAAAAAGGALVSTDRRIRALAVACALAAATVVLVGHIWNTDQFRSISGDAVLFTVLAIAGLAAVAGLAIAFTRWPPLFPLMAVAALPFRVPIDAGATTVNLLVPLYFVIAGASVAYVWRQLRAGPRSQLRDGEPRSRPSPLELAIAAFLALYALQSLYSRDFDTALEQVVFFYVPFALLFRSLTEVRWDRSLLVGCAAVLTVMALAFSAIGFWEYGQRELLWNPKVISANQFESYFRVNSVFWDPNIYGRFLAIVIVVLAAAMLWNGRRDFALATAALLAILWGGLVLTFSQSSFVALLAGLAVLAALRWDARRMIAVTAVLAALGAVFLLVFQDTLRIQLGSSSGLNKATSGRLDLIQGGGELFADRPLWGYGSGSFARAFRLERKGNQQQAVSASHTLPLTVAAEQGLIGLAAYLLLVVTALATLFGRPGWPGPARPPPALADGGLASGDLSAFVPARAALAAAFVTILVHTMMYAAFLEDPFTWVVLATGLAVAPFAVLAERSPRAAPAPAAEPAAAPC
jgi:O-antigen ligase